MASLAASDHRQEEAVQPAPRESYRRRQDGAVEISELWRILWHRRFMILAMAGLFAGLALAYGVLTAPLYTASAQLLIDPRDRNVVSNDVNPSSVSPDGGLAQVESQASVIQSTSVLMRAIRETKLAEDSEFNGLGLLSRLLGRVAADPPNADGSLTPAEARTLANLRRKFSVRRADKVFVVDVVVTTKEAEKSARLANAIAEAYLADQADARSKAATEAADSLTARLDEQRKRVEKAENAVERYRAQNNLVASSGRLISDQQLGEISNQLSAAQARTAALKSQVEQIAQQRRGGAGLAGSSAEAIQSPVIAKLREQEATLVQREADLQSQLGPRHPAIGAAQSQLVTIRRMIATEIARVEQSVRTDYERAQGNEKLLAGKLEALTRQTQGADQASVRLRELQRDLEAARTVYASFLLRAQETREQASLDTTNARVISRAQPPQQSSWPPTLPLIAAAGMLGLGLGAGLALIREYAAPHLISRAQAEALVGAPVIAVLRPGRPAARRRWRLRKTAPASTEARNEAGFALLRLFNAPDNAATAARSLLLTSVEGDAADRERVTDLLAEAAVQQGERVLLIDADLEKEPEEAGPGLMDLLRGESSLEAAIHFGASKDVAMMSGGRRKAPPQKGVGRSFATRMLADASRHFDLVVMDGGSLGRNVRIAPLVGMAEEIVLVARLYGTRQNDIVQAMEAARIMGRTITATILVESGGHG
ncbi:exopolysaccharide transport family protein [Bosea sp. ANAM02]|uniref:GumC family protein n=1 Tax=Bosea sp. ANAM02 TaxID=2020412 RepID=UPI00156559A5|nr:exopolysaccharide transport family protein [Bosea sp. ANAM02]